MSNRQGSYYHFIGKKPEKQEADRLKGTTERTQKWDLGGHREQSEFYIKCCVAAKKKKRR